MAANSKTDVMATSCGEIFVDGMGVSIFVGVSISIDFNMRFISRFL